jgi:hypothetical protein
VFDWIKDFSLWQFSNCSLAFILEKNGVSDRIK